ncbi:MAG: hypothetical protein IPM97_01250 [Bdellovibrionaceae bacterium]|nr:hypothetical protein [Pseudobdellovibrionaceae bacterium]
MNGALKYFSLTILIVCQFVFEVRAGHETGHGGDGRASEFVAMAQLLLKDLKAQPIPGIDTAKLESAISQTKVRSSADTLSDIDSGKKVDAINHPQKTPPEIVISRSAWDTIASGFERRRLVLHEYLNIAGVDDRQYQLSSLFDRARVCTRSPAMRAALERSFGGTSCDKITEKDLLKIHTLEFHEGDSVEKILSDDLIGLDLEKLNVVAPNWQSLDPQVWSGLMHLTSNWSPQASQKLSVTKIFKKLKRLELHRVALLTPGDFGELPALEELVLVSEPAKMVPIKANAFLALSKSPLRRLVLCDISETGKTNYVQVPSFIVKKDSLRGLTGVKEATLCMSFGNSHRELADKNPLKSLPSLTHLWFKTDNWSSLEVDFFMSTSKGTRIALVPSGRPLYAAEIERFKGLNCKNGWDWSKEKTHQFISGKVYCIRN